MNNSGLRNRLSSQLGVTIDTVKRQSTAQLESLRRLFLSPGCAVCDRPTGRTFCIDCHRQLPETAPASTGPATRKTCATQKAKYAVQGWYQDTTHSLPVSALGIYSGSLKRAILAMKYNRRPDVAGVLGHQLGKQWSQIRPCSISPLASSPLAPSVPVLPSSISPSSIYAIPVPLHRERQLQRGYNQAELIARAFCKTSGLPLLADGLERPQATRPQHQLSLSERQQNLAAAFQPGKAVQRICKSQQTPGPAAVIIDDIYTTGTTARSAAETLTEAGMPVIGILAIARAVL